MIKNRRGFSSKLEIEPLGVVWGLVRVLSECFWGTLGVLLGGPWGPKRFKATKRKNIKKTRKTTTQKTAKTITYKAQTRFRKS